MYLYNPNYEENEAKKIILRNLIFLGRGGFGQVNEIIKTALQREILILEKMNICENSVKFDKYLKDNIIF